jgi:hypothetical protein
VIARAVLVILLGAETAYFLWTGFVFIRLFSRVEPVWAAPGWFAVWIGAALLCLALLVAARPRWVGRASLPLSLAAMAYGGWTVAATRGVVMSLSKAWEGDAFAQEEISGAVFVAIGIVGLWFRQSASPPRRRS